MDLVIHLPTCAARGTVVFYHAGGFTAGSPTKIGCENLARVLCDRGYAVVLPAYRLRPDCGQLDRLAPYERLLWNEYRRRRVEVPRRWANRVAMAATEDAAAAVEWWRANRARYGVDSDEIRLWGNSSGGVLVFNLLFLHDLLRFETHGIASAAIFAGGYFHDLTRARTDVPIHAWHTTGDPRMPFAAVAGLATRQSVDVGLTYGEGDFHGFGLFPNASKAALVDSALAKRSRVPA